MKWLTVADRAAAGARLVATAAIVALLLAGAIAPEAAAVCAAALGLRL